MYALPPACKLSMNRTFCSHSNPVESLEAQPVKPHSLSAPSVALPTASTFGSSQRSLPPMPWAHARTSLLYFVEFDMKN